MSEFNDETLCDMASTVALTATQAARELGDESGAHATRRVINVLHEAVTGEDVSESEPIVCVNAHERLSLEMSLAEWSLLLNMARLGTQTMQVVTLKRI